MPYTTPFRAVFDYCKTKGAANIVFAGLFPGATPVYALPSSVLDSVGLGTLLNPTFHCGMSPSCDIDQAIAFADANGKRIAYTDQYPQSSVSLFGISNTPTFRSEEHTSEIQSLMRI